MGTTYHLSIDPRGVDRHHLALQIEQRLSDINQQMSTYLASSAITRFNQAQANQCIPLPKDILYVIKQALALSKKTNGLFDITVAPLVESWGFGKTVNISQPPKPVLITKKLKQVGYKKLTLKTGCVVKQVSGLSINLSAIAKGYAVDELAKIMVDNKIDHYLVEIGGEIASKGINAKGRPWVIAIESANSHIRLVQRLIKPNGMGVATSGDYRQYFEKKGKRFSHVLNPLTGYPIEHRLASVTVLHPQTMMADALATAMMVMGEKAALDYAVKHQLAIFMLVREKQGFTEVLSPAFQAYWLKDEHAKSLKRMVHNR